MKTDFLPDISMRDEDLTPPSRLHHVSLTDAISVCFCPHLKLISAEWIRNTADNNLRHTIRLLARTAAVLRAELLLISIPVTFLITEEDMHWIVEFMQKVMRQSPVRKVARVIPSHIVHGERENTLLLHQTPYEAALFNTIEHAQKWLLGDRVRELTEESRIRIPLQFNLKHIRNLNKLDLPPVSTGIPPRKLQLLDICTDFVAISVDQRKSLMRIYWKKPPQSRQYRYGMLKACRAFVAYKLHYLLLNNQRMGVLTLEDQSWLISTAQKILPHSNLHKLAVISSANGLQQLSNDNIEKRLKEAPLQQVTQHFLSEEEALEWLLSD